jgi:hypothetical protein
LLCLLIIFCFGIANIPRSPIGEGTCRIKQMPSWP